MREIEKRVLKRLETIFNDPILYDVIFDFGFEYVRRSSAIQGLAEFLTEIIPDGSEMTCLEIGTHYGVSSLILGRHFKKVITYDVEQWPYVEQIADGYPFDIERYVLSYEEILYVLKMQKYDVAFLDGDHSNVGFEFDFARHCGRVIFHEYWFDQKQVWDLVNSLMKYRIKTGGLCFAYYENI